MKKKPSRSPIPYGSVDRYEAATEELFRREYGDLAQLRAGQEELLTVRSGNQWLAAPLRGIRAVVKVAAMTPVPFVPKWVLGVALLQGNMLPVFHLGHMLGVTDEDAGGQARLLLLPGAGGLVAFQVDEIGEVIAVSEASITPTSPGPYQAGTVRREGRNLSLLDLQALTSARPPLAEVG